MRGPARYFRNVVRACDRFVSRDFSIRTRLIALVAVAIVPLIAWTVLAVARQRERDRQALLTEVHNQARQFAQRIDNDISHLEGLLHSLSVALSLDSAEIGRNEERLAAACAHLDGHIVNVMAHRIDGTPLGASSRERRPTPEASGHAALRHDGPSFEEPVASPTTGRWTLNLAQSLPGPDGRPAAILRVTFDLLALGEMLKPESKSALANVPAGVLVSVFDANRLVIARTTDPAIAVGKRAADNATLNRVITTKDGSMDFTNTNGQRRLGGWTTCSRAPWTIFVRVNHDEAFAEADARLRATILWSATALALGLTLAWLVSDRIARPIQHLTDDVISLGAGQQPRFTAVKSIREIRVLAQAFGAMSARLQRRDADLRRRIDELQTLFDVLPVGVAIAVDPSGRDIRVNPALGRILGVPPGTNASLTVPAGAEPAPYRLRRQGREIPPDELPIQRAMAENRAVTDFEHTIVRDDGTSVDVLLNAVPLHDEAGAVRGCLAIVLDLTARKQAEHDRLQLERKLLETQKLESLGVLAGGIAHDFNNILTVILNHAGLAHLDLPADSPVQQNLVHIREGSVRAAGLCRQMLAYSGKGQFVVRKLDLNGVLADTTDLLKVSISKRATLRFDLRADLPPIEADVIQIRQVIMNLVLNASEALGERDGEISLATDVVRATRAELAGMLLGSELPEAVYVTLAVSDDGCGMTAEMQARVFDPFFTTKFTGRGLGLAAVLGIVRGHKGALTVRSQSGRGTTFKLLFPVAAGVADPTNEGGSTAPLAHSSGCVLVVDDEEPVRVTAATTLRRMGLEVETACDGREAADRFALQPNRFDLVLLDLTMPRLDGGQALAELRRLRPQVRVVLMSGFNEQESVARCNGNRPVGFLQKPFDYEALGLAVRRALGDGAWPRDTKDVRAETAPGRDPP